MLPLDMSVLGLALRGQQVGAAIRSLFRSGQQGAWYDPSDMTTLFQDSAGTTPVTAVQQPVGLMLDKRLGLVRGPELVTNGSCTGTTGWTGYVNLTSPGNATIRADTGAGGLEAYARSSFAVVAGRSYQITFDLIAANNTGAVDVGGSRVLIPGPTNNSGSKSLILTAAVSNSFGVSLFTNTPTGGYFIEVDNVSVREIPGNHATQATAASRPVLSARVNLLAKTGSLNATRGPGFIYTDGVSDQLGGNSAVRIQWSTVGNAFSQPAGASVPANTAVTGRIRIKSNGNAARLRVGLGAGDASTYAYVDINPVTGASSVVAVVNSANIISAASSSVQLVNGWFEVTISATNSTLLTIVLFVAASFDANGDCFIFGAQLETGSVATRYQRVNTATDYDTAGFPLYEALDGVDDSVSTATGGGGTTGFFLCQGVNQTTRGVPLATPVNAAFATATTGGTLAAATHFYRVSALNSMGETLASAETSIATTGTTSTATINWGAVAGATGYRVFGRTTGAQLLLATVGAVTTFVDDGALTPAGALPAVNTTAFVTVLSDTGVNTGYAVRINSAGQLVLRAGNGTAFTSVVSGATLALGVSSVITAWDDGANLNVQINNGAVASVARPVVAAGTEGFTIGKISGEAAGFFRGNLYAGVYRSGSGLTAAQRASTQAYIASKTGVTL